MVGLGGGGVTLVIFMVGVVRVNGGVLVVVFRVGGGGDGGGTGGEDMVREKRALLGR